MLQTATAQIQSMPFMSRELRDQLVLEHLSLVRAIAIRVHETLPVHVDLEDLIHAGVLGLISAVEKYDSDKNVAFQSFAKHRIKGSILDSLRQMDWASRDQRRRQKQVDSAARDLSLKLGRIPTETELADELGLSMDRWRQVSLDLRSLASAVAVPQRHADDDRDLAEVVAATPDVRPDRICEREQMRNTLEKAIGSLPKRYQKVVFLYYTNDMTMKEIGDVLGVNESRVSQIHKTALRKMAVTLEAEGIRSARSL